MQEERLDREKLKQALDVFLTTAKPLQKVVTAQDIQSSLYYIHEDSQDDRRLCEVPNDDIAGTHENEFTENGEVSKTVSKKSSVIEASRNSSGCAVAPAQGKSLHASGRPSSNNSRGMEQIARKPIASLAQPAIEASPTEPGSSNARIIGPRAMGQHVQAANTPGLAPAYGKENIAPRRWPDQPATARSLSPSKPQPPQSMRKPDYGKGSVSILSGDARESSPVHSERMLNHEPDAPGPPHASKEECPSLTLIRRYDGTQKNVGRIVTNSSKDLSLYSKQYHNEEGQTIIINTPGYSIFRPSNPRTTPLVLDEVFKRRLGRLRRRSQSSEPDQNGADTKDHRKSRMSIDFRRMSRPHLDDNSDSYKAPARSQDPKSSTMKGYGFLSPWNGTCEFSSGFTGHALKCKHTAPTPGSQASTVSELRFNLPSSSTPGTASPIILRSPDRPTAAKRASYFSSRHKNGGKDHDEHPQDADPMDQINLSLGREHAGGGFSGKQAKLGKLIVEGEGLQMLDLIVAANMGLWWKVYEKSA
ncbi:MAG: hypothetical protein Q9218_001289 [Villophora microphyllina]